MKTMLLFAALAAVMIVGAGCTVANAPVIAPLGLDMKGPVAVGDVSAGSTSVGRSQAIGIILVGVGDASISAAAKEGNISRIHHVENDTLNILGIYSRYETVVYGQ